MTEVGREWDAASYHRISVPQVEWGRAVLDRLPLQGDETVLDAGCGTGLLTALLLERLPRGRVIALDRSMGMARAALTHLGPLAPGRVAAVEADLLALPLRGAVDAVFSTATFHWVLDHPALFGGVFAALRPGGQLVAQCGGGPNVKRLHDRATALLATPPYNRRLSPWSRPWEFADAPTTARRLAAAGFCEVSTEVVSAPVRMPDRAAFVEFTSTIVLRPHLAVLPEELRSGFVETLADAAAADTPAFLLDYWRLNLSGRRPG